MLVYMAIYDLVITIGGFPRPPLRRGGKAVEEIADFAGLSRAHPKLAVVFSLLMFSMAGIPPLAGFSPSSMYSWPRSRRSV